MTLRNILLAGTALGAAAFLAVPAQAGSKDCCGDVDALKQQINDLQQKVDDLAINYGNKIKDLESRKGDVITSANKQRVEDLGDLKKAVSSSKDQLLLRILRGNAALYLVLK